MRRSPRRFFVALIAATSLGVGACALPSDDSARLVSNPDIESVIAPSTSTTTSSTVLAATNDYEVFFLDQESLLVADERKLPLEATVGDLLSELTRPPESRRLTTDVPEDTVFDDMEMSDDGTLTINLSEESTLLTLGGTQLTRAIAQIVVTATQVDGDEIESIRFMRAGDEGVATIPRDGGDTTDPVDECDYLSFLPDDLALECRTRPG